MQVGIMKTRQDQFASQVNDLRNPASEFLQISRLSNRDDLSIPDSQCFDKLSIVLGSKDLSVKQQQLNG